MIDNSILEALTQLKSDLKDIKSEKEQIDSVLKADGEITDSLAKYSQQLGAIATQLGSLKNFIKSEVKSIVSDIDSDIKDRLISVGKHVSRVTQLSSELEYSVKRVNSHATEQLNLSCNNIIQSFEASTNNVCKQFSKQASDSIDKLIHTAKDIKDSSKDFSEAKIKIIQRIDGITHNIIYTKEVIVLIDKSISDLVSEYTKHTKELQFINNSINQCLTNFNNYHANIQSALKSIEEQNDKNTYELKKAINISKNILFVIVFLVVVDIIMHFI